AGIKYRVPTTRTLFSADLIAASGQRATSPGGSPNGTSLPSYQHVNLSLVQPIETGWYKGMELRFDLLNVFDQIYQIRNGSGVGDRGAGARGPRLIRRPRREHGRAAAAARDCRRTPRAHRARDALGPQHRAAPPRIAPAVPCDPRLRRPVYRPVRYRVGDHA